jgi:hypothetical protein
MQWRSTIAVVFVVLTRCSGEPRDIDRDASSAPATGGISLTGYIEDLNSAGLAGVEVCEDTSARCATSLESGRFTLDRLVPDAEILLVARKSGYVSVLVPLVAPHHSATAGFPTLIGPVADVVAPDLENALLRDAGRPTIDEADLSDAFTTIFIGAHTADGASLEAGIHVELSPASGYGPFYNAFDGTTVLDLAPGQSAVLGYFLGVEPREDGYELVYEYDGGNCRYQAGPTGGWPAESGRTNATRVPARAGFTTYYTEESCLPAEGAAADGGGSR